MIRDKQDRIVIGWNEDSPAPDFPAKIEQSSHRLLSIPVFDVAHHAALLQ